MKLKLIAVALVLGVTVGHAKANQRTTLSTTSIAQNSDSWIMVKNEKGLIISLKDEILPSGRYLSIKFENSSNKEISFSWELVHKGKVIKTTNLDVVIEPNRDLLIINSKMGVKLLSSDLINDFFINIILN